MIYTAYFDGLQPVVKRTDRRKHTKKVLENSRD